MDNQLEDNKMDEPFKVFKIRWLILFIYVLGSAASNMQWMQYGIIGDVLILYYGVSFEAVNWSSMVYLLFYVLLVFPGSYVLDKYGLRVSMIIGMLGTSIGAWVKLASVAPDRYWVLLLGQIIVAISQVFFLAIPAKLAAVWFGSNEVSTACGIGIAGIQDGFVDAGRIGLLMVLAGIIGSLLTGAALDKFKFYRGTLVALKFLNVLMLVLFTYTIHISIIFVYVTTGLLGLFNGGLWSVGFEATAEATYPEPEGITVGLMYACGQGLGILLTYLYSFLLYEMSDVWANNVVSTISLIGFVMISFARFELRREAANFKKNTDNLGYTENYSTKL